MIWLVKRRQYGGGESVVGHGESRSAAQQQADTLNYDYQTDVYYVEEYDRAKVEWPDITDPKFAEILARFKD